MACCTAAGQLGSSAGPIRWSRRARNQPHQKCQNKCVTGLACRRFGCSRPTRELLRAICHLQSLCGSTTSPNSSALRAGWGSAEVKPAKVAKSTDFKTRMSLSLASSGLLKTFESQHLSMPDTSFTTGSMDWRLFRISVSETTPSRCRDSWPSKGRGRNGRGRPRKSRRQTR